MRLLWVSFVVLVVDQISKAVVVNTMYRGQSIPVIGDWLLLTYTENPGMAFGIRFGPPSLITYLSIFATLVILAYLFSVRKGYAPYRMSLGLVFGGAVGNIIDRVSYGPLFQGNPWLEGRVVDFVHVNLWQGPIPDVIPFIGGRHVALFPIWNVADMAIVTGVVGILLFQQGFHRRLTQAALDPAKTSDEAASGSEDEAVDHVGMMEAAVTASTLAVSETMDLSADGVETPKAKVPGPDPSSD